MVIVVFKWFYINSFFTFYFVAWDDSILLYCFISAWYYQHSIIISNCLEYIPISSFWGVIYLFSVGQSSIISWWNPAVILRPNLPRWHLPARSWFTTPVVHYFFSDIYHKPTLSLETNLANLGINHQSHVSLWLNSPFNRGLHRTVKHRKWSGSPRNRSTPRLRHRANINSSSCFSGSFLAVSNQGGAPKKWCECWFIIPWKL